MAKRVSGPAAPKSGRAQLDEAAKEVAAMAASAPETNLKPLDIALSSSDVLDRIEAKMIRTGSQPEVYYIPTSTLSTWVVFLFPPMLPPSTFRVPVDIGSETAGTIEDPYIRDRFA